VDGRRTRYDFRLSGSITMSSTHNPKDRFETLCHVVADISAARSTCTVGKSGKPCYSQEYDVVLLVGLTELKAEIRWLDSTTVRIHK
jgi:hypothetical protein